MSIIDRFKSAYKAFQGDDTPNNVKTSEKSTYVSPYYDKSYLRPYNPDEIVQKKGLSIYREMMMDDQVKAVMYMKRLSVLSTGGSVEADKDDPRGEEKAEFIRYVLENLSGSFNRSLFKILTAYQYGFSVTEKILKRYKTGPFKGKVGIKKLKTRPPDSFEFHTDDAGNLDKVIQHQSTGDSKIDPKYFIIYTYDEEFDGNFYGNSDLNSAYKGWWNKKFNRKFRNIRNERYGMPLAVGYYDRGAGDEEKNELFKMVKNLQSKSAGILPKPTDDEDIIDFIESKAQSGKDDVYRAAINYEDRSIARALLMPDMLGFSENKNGSRALGETQFSLYLQILNFLRGEIEDEVVFEQIIKPLIDINFPDSSSYPAWTFNPLTEEDKQDIVDSWSNAVQKGAVSPTPKDVNHTRDLLGYPEQEEEPEETNMSEGCQHKHFAMNRRPNKYEKRMNFADIRDNLDAREEEVIKEASNIMEKVRDDLLDEIIETQPTENSDVAFIRNIDIDTSELEPVFRESFKEIYDKGRQKASEIIDDREFQSMASLDLPPEKAREWFDTQAQFAAKGISDELNDKTKQKLLTGLSQGKSTKEIVQELEKTFAPYVDEKVAKDLVEKPHRISTIVRTNYTTAYNKGIKMESQQSDVVKAFEYSAIIDSRTTAYCSSMDGKIFRKNNSNFRTPPAHFNCFPGDTMVTVKKNGNHTTRKHKLIKNVKLGQEVLTKSGVFFPVSTVFEREYNGELIKINTGNRELSMTPNHPVYTKRGWVRADELTVNDEIKTVPKKVSYKLNRKLYENGENIIKDYRDNKISFRQLDDKYDISIDSMKKYLKDNDVNIRHGSEAVKTQWIENDERRKKASDNLKYVRANFPHWKLGKKDPEQSKRMKENNPMYNEETRKKMAKSLKGMFKGDKNPMYGKSPGHGKFYLVETPYQGTVKVRSSYEKIFVEYCNNNGIDYLYEPKRFNISENKTYKPDFYLMDIGCFIEVKGWVKEKDFDKLYKFRESNDIPIYMLGKKKIKEYKKCGKK